MGSDPLQFFARDPAPCRWLIHHDMHLLVPHYHIQRTRLLYKTFKTCHRIKVASACFFQVLKVPSNWEAPVLFPAPQHICQINIVAICLFSLNLVNLIYAVECVFTMLPVPQKLIDRFTHSGVESAARQ